MTRTEDTKFSRFFPKLMFLWVLMKPGLEIFCVLLQLLMIGVLFGAEQFEMPRG